MHRRHIPESFRRLLLFLLILFALNGVISLYFYKVSTRNHKMVRQDRVFHKAPKKIDYLIMGHSRPFRAIDITSLPHAVNFCSGGESNINTYYKLRNVLEKSNKEVHTVILPAGFASFSQNKPEGTGNAFYWKRYVDYFEVGRETDDRLSYFSIWLKAKVVPWYEYPYIRMSMLTGDATSPIDVKGYANGSEEERLQQALKLANLNNDTKAIFDEASMTYLKKTIALCKKHNCRLIYVKYPISKYYQEATQLLPNAEKLNKRSQEFDATIRESGITMFDFTHLFDDQQDYFKDPHHLGKQAQQIFTQHLKQSLDSLSHYTGSESSFAYKFR